jgi:hypothetical protein
LLTSVAALGCLFLASSPEAAQITFGPSNQSITYTGHGNGSVDVSSPTLTGMAFDTTNSLVGSFTLSALNFTTAPQVAGIFDIPANTETFTYTNPDTPDTFTETVHFTDIQDNTPQPKMYGTATLTSISGDAAFLAAFGPAGTASNIDFLSAPLICTPTTNCLTLDFLATTTASASATISSGENLSADVSVSEPFSLALLGTALPALA